MEKEEKYQNTLRLLVDRNVMTQEILIKESGYEARDKSIAFAFRQYCLQLRFLSMLTGCLPVAHWLPKYSVKKYLVGDLMAGATVAVMHIPQGMAYGILAGLTPNVGLYMAFFPVLTYFLFGTSKHISIGTFAVVSMMTLKVVQTHSVQGNGTLEETDFVSSPKYTALEVATATSIVTGIVHLIMGLLCLGTLANLLSEPLVNGFTTGAAVHVVVSQLKDMLGLSLKRHKGPFKLIYTLTDLFGCIHKTNLASLIISIGILIFMMLMNEVVKPLLKKKTRFPIPAELIAVISGTLISRFTEIGPKYDVELVGDIPTGLPAPQLPPVALFAEVWFDATVIAVVTYSVVISMGFIFAKKHSYTISPNQELFALGISNVVGGIFSCIPTACSLSRSLIQEQTGGMTQIASVISATLILMVLLWIGPLFKTLPRCVLAGVIIVALKGMFMQAKDVKRFAKEGKLEVLLWVCTFVGVVLIDIDYGLILGCAISLMFLYIKGWKSSYSLLGNMPGTELYVDLGNHKNAVEVPNTKIFRYFGSINFATQTSYKKFLYALIELSPGQLQDTLIVKVEDSNSSAEHKLLNQLKVLILDLHAVGHIDMAGSKTLSEIVNEMELKGVKVCLTSPSSIVYDALVHAMALSVGSFNIFPTVHDAVLYSKSWRLA